MGVGSEKHRSGQIEPFFGKRYMTDALVSAAADIVVVLKALLTGKLP